MGERWGSTTASRSLGALFHAYMKRQSFEEETFHWKVQQGLRQPPTAIVSYPFNSLALLFSQVNYHFTKFIRSTLPLYLKGLSLNRWAQYRSKQFCDLCYTGQVGLNISFTYTAKTYITFLIARSHSLAYKTKWKCLVYMRRQLVLRIWPRKDEYPVHIKNSMNIKISLYSLPQKKLGPISKKRISRSI